nr:Ger(x)C family spore germination protein [Tumebacillus amylolyticus]
MIAVLTSVLLVGCWDRRELEERTSVVALGIDSEEREAGGQPLIKVSFQIPIANRIAGSGGGSGGEGGKRAVKVMSATGASMADAMRVVQSRLNQELFYGHTRVIAISEKVARTSDMAGIVDSLRRNPQMRRLLWMVITKGDAKQLLESDPKLEQIPIVYVMDMLENGAKSGRIPDITLGSWFVDRSSSGIEATSNYILPTKNDVNWRGLALFRDDRMVGQIEEKEAWILLQSKDEKIGGNITVPCPKKSNGSTWTEYTTAHPKKIHVNTQVEPYGKSYKMSQQIQVEVDIIESNCEMNFKNDESFTEIEKALSAELNARAAKLIADTQGKYGVDVFGLGNKVRARYHEQFKKINWLDEFPKAKIEIHYDVKIRRVGMKME